MKIYPIDFGILAEFYNKFGIEDLPAKKRKPSLIAPSEREIFIMNEPKETKNFILER
jgi:hypothetical protein